MLAAEIDITVVDVIVYVIAVLLLILYGQFFGRGPRDTTPL
jgi:hypothetical protein